MNYETCELITVACHQAVIGVLTARGLPVDDAALDRFLSPPQVRNMLILTEYNIGRENGVKSEALLAGIADKYCISYESAYSITHRKPGRPANKPQ